MWMKTRFIYSVLIACIAVSPVFAQTDAGLDTRVTLHLPVTDFTRLTTELTRQTGVHFRARKDIGDEKLSVFVKDYPVKSLMHNVAYIFGYKWGGRSGQQTEVHDLAGRLRPTEVGGQLWQRLSFRSLRSGVPIC